MQSRGALELQQQVESLLGALVKAAAVELTKLFERTYLAAASPADTGRGDDQSGSLKTLNVADNKRSVGVQVDVVDCGSSELSGPLLSSGGTGLNECTSVEEEGRELFVAEDNGPTDTLQSPVQQDVAETVDMVEQHFLELENPAPSHSQDDVLQVKEERLCKSNVTIDPSAQQSSDQQELLMIQQNSSVITPDQMKFVCPLIIKPQPPIARPENAEQPVHTEPQQASVSTAKGKAYSPSPSDGTITPAQAGVSPKNPLLLKLNALDVKLLKPCAVQLVNLLTVPEAPLKPEGGVVNSKTVWPLPKDLRRHQSLHTGHRLCCFTRCETGVWRLQKIVTHSRKGYACSNCGKKFKHRKILRRHERFHTGEKPYSCSVCSKTFALRKSLRRHLRFHTGERPHTCTQCGKCFRLRENLKAHLRFHTGEKPFNCSTCGKTFRIQKNLEKHTQDQCGFFVPSFRTIAGL